MTAALIDEIPALAILGAVTENGLTVRDASELRIKETDRIATVVENMRRMGIEAEAHRTACTFPASSGSARRNSILTATTASRWHSRSRRWPPMARARLRMRMRPASRSRNFTARCRKSRHKITAM